MIYSYSKLADFKKCPRFFEAAHILKIVSRETMPALVKGRTIHKELEKALADREVLPPKGLQINGAIWYELIRAGALPEVRLAVDKNFRDCDYFASDVYLRGIIDVLVRSNERILCLDWKSGKPGYTDVLQAQVYAAMLYAAREIEKISFVYAYVCYGLQDHVVVNGKQAIEDVKKLIETIENTEEFLPAPGFFCRYCNVQDCEYYKGRRKRKKLNLHKVR